MARSSAPTPGFNYDEVGKKSLHYPLPTVLTLLESSSPGSSAHDEDEVPPLDAPRAVVQSSDATPVIYPPLTRVEEHVDAVGSSSHGITKFKKWIQMRTGKSKKDPSLREHNRVSRKSRRRPDGHSPSQSATRVDATNEGPSRIAAGIRVRVGTLP